LADDRMRRTRISYARGCTGLTIDVSIARPSLAVISSSTRSASAGRNLVRQPATTALGASPALARTGLSVAPGNAAARKRTYEAK
jgi:hypothetical protein